MDQKNTVATATEAAAKAGKSDQKILVVKPDFGKPPAAIQTQAVIVKAESIPATQPPAAAIPEANPLKSISARLELMQELDKLFTQRDDVSESLQDLSEFKPSASGGDTVIIRRQDGKSHSTSHPEAISGMVDEARKRLKNKLEDLENRILNLF